jgi:iron complex transport system substrate-binding protein
VLQIKGKLKHKVIMLRRNIIPFKCCLLLLLIFINQSCINRKVSLDKNKELSNEIVKAERLSIERKDGYTEVKIINPWQGATNIGQTYYLVKRGSKLPEGVDSASVIFVPLRKIVCMSTTHVAMIEVLGEANSIVGVSGTDFIYSPVLLKNVDNGLLADVGYESSLNKELILKLSPDLIMIYGIGSESAGYVGKIKELGIKVIINADYLETDPLSRTEWLKLFGALYNKESMADSIYQSETRQYNKIKLLISEKAVVKPKVLLGLPFKDSWNISPGNSFISTLVNDAGGNYLWSDTKSSKSMPYGIENVYLRAIDADFWLNISSVKSKKEILNLDERLRDLPCFKNGNLYNNNKRITEKGGNDYWESGSVYPHILLKDIAAILHPDLFAGYELTYYKKLD